LGERELENFSETASAATKNRLLLVCESIMSW